MHAPNPQTSRAVLLRIVAAVAVTGAFVLTATLVDPSRSRAGEGGSVRDLVPDNRPAVLPVSGPAPLGELRGRRYTIEIESGMSRPVYRVIDSQGRVRGENLRDDEVYTVDEDLTVDRLIGEPLMLADPAW